MAVVLILQADLPQGEDAEAEPLLQQGLFAILGLDLLCIYNHCQLQHLPSKLEVKMLFILAFLLLSLMLVSFRSFRLIITLIHTFFLSGFRFL